MPNDVVGLVKEGVIEQLERYRDEVRQVADSLSEKELWTKPMEPSNSVGHLILHLTGNLNHFVGAQLGATGYVRDREREFTESNPPDKATALAGLDNTVAMFRRVVGGLSAEQLAGPHPEKRFGTVYQALLHLLMHFALHRGQMSYIARLVADRQIIVKFGSDTSDNAWPRSKSARTDSSNLGKCRSVGQLVPKNKPFFHKSKRCTVGPGRHLLSDVLSVRNDSY